MNNKTKIIGISGGTGSGKTYLTKKLINIYSENLIGCIEVDSYYKDLSHISMDKRIKNNFDHPSSIDFNLLINDLTKIINNKSINIPMYDYKTHTRTNQTKLINNSHEIILLEGIYALHIKKIIEMLSCAVYIDINENIRKNRRIKRDLEKRARTYDSVITQYNNSVLPMHEKYIEPSKKNANIIIKKIDKTDSEYSKLLATINKILSNDKKTKK